MGEGLASVRGCGARSTGRKPQVSPSRILSSEDLRQLHCSENQRDTVLALYILYWVQCGHCLLNMASVKPIVGHSLLSGDSLI